MSDLGVVPVGLNARLKEELELYGSVPTGPVSFVSKPKFEFYRDPKTGAISSMSGTGLLASKVLYSLFSPVGGYAVDSTKGSYIESLVGSTFDKATLTVNLVRSIQKAEEDIKTTSEFTYSPDPDEELDYIEVVNVELTGSGEATVTLKIVAQSGKVSSLQVDVQ